MTKCPLIMCMTITAHYAHGSLISWFIKRAFAAIKSSRNLTCNDLEEVEKVVPVHRSQGVVRGSKQLHDTEDDIIRHQSATAAGWRIMIQH